MGVRLSTCFQEASGHTAGAGVFETEMKRRRCRAVEGWDGTPTEKNQGAQGEGRPVGWREGSLEGWKPQLRGGELSLQVLSGSACQPF